MWKSVIILFFNLLIAYFYLFHGSEVRKWYFRNESDEASITTSQFSMQRRSIGAVALFVSLISIYNIFKELGW